MACSGSFGGASLELTVSPAEEVLVGRRGRPPEVQRTTLDLVDSGQAVAAVLGISVSSIYTWRRQGRIDRGLAPGLSSMEGSELSSAKRRIAELEAGPAAYRRASDR